MQGWTPAHPAPTRDSVASCPQPWPQALSWTQIWGQGLCEGYDAGLQAKAVLPGRGLDPHHASWSPALVPGGVARGRTHMCRLFQRLNSSGPVSPSHHLVQRVEGRSHGGLPGQLEACRGTGSQGEAGSGRGCHVGSRFGGGSRSFCPCFVPSRLSQASGKGRAWPALPGGRAGKASLQNRVDSGEPGGS